MSLLRCPDCKGHGFTIEVVRWGKPSAQEVDRRCERCEGTGRIDPCEGCGEGVPDDGHTLCANCQDKLATPLEDGEWLS